MIERRYKPEYPGLQIESRLYYRAPALNSLHNQDEINDWTYRRDIIEKERAKSQYNTGSGPKLSARQTLLHT